MVPSRPSGKLVCAACGSDRVRRSRPKTLGEELARTFLRARFHVCRACRARGWHLGRRSGARREAAERAGRAVTSSSRRRLEAYRRTSRITILSIASALLLGVAIAYFAWWTGSRPMEPQRQPVRGLERRVGATPRRGR